MASLEAQATSKGFSTHTSQFVNAEVLSFPLHLNALTALSDLLRNWLISKEENEGCDVVLLFIELSDATPRVWPRRCAFLSLLMVFPRSLIDLAELEVWLVDSVFLAFFRAYQNTIKSLESVTISATSFVINANKSVQRLITSEPAKFLHCWHLQLTPHVAPFCAKNRDSMMRLENSQAQREFVHCSCTECKVLSVLLWWFDEL